jgi:NTE family protein
MSTTSCPTFWWEPPPGPLNAAFVASRPQTPATARALARIWRALQREDIFPVSMRAVVGGLCGRRDHLVPDHALRDLVRRYIEFDDLADAAVPLHLVAFDLTGGRELLLSEGPAVDAVAASAAIPGVFPLSPSPDGGWSMAAWSTASSPPADSRPTSPDTHNRPS